jgi:integrase/recombinase XerD
MAFLDHQGVDRFQDVTPGHLEAYRLGLSKRKLVSNSVYDALRIIRALFAHLEATQVIFDNPVRGVVLPKYERRLMPVPSEAELKKLLLQPDVTTPAGIRNRAIMEVAYSTGARLGELVRMNLLSVDRAGRVIRILGKGRKERVLPLGKTAMTWLETYLSKARPALGSSDPDESALWVCRGGGRIKEISIQLMIRQEVANRHRHIDPAWLPGSNPHGVALLLRVAGRRDPGTRCGRRQLRHQDPAGHGQRS